MRWLGIAYAVLTLFAFPAMANGEEATTFASALARYHYQCERKYMSLSHDGRFAVSNDIDTAVGLRNTTSIHDLETGKRHVFPTALSAVISQDGSTAFVLYANDLAVFDLRSPERVTRWIGLGGGRLTGWNPRVSFGGLRTKGNFGYMALSLDGSPATLFEIDPTRLTARKLFADKRDMSRWQVVSDDVAVAFGDAAEIDPRTLRPLQEISVYRLDRPYRLAGLTVRPADDQESIISILGAVSDMATPGPGSLSEASALSGSFAVRYETAAGFNRAGIWDAGTQTIRPVPLPPDGDATAALMTASGTRVLGWGGNPAAPRVALFDAAGAAIADRVGSLFGGPLVHLEATAADQDGARLVFKAVSRDGDADHVLVDRSAQSARRLEARCRIPGRHRFTALRIRTRDGLEIPAWSVEPTKRRGVGTVILVHGGPHSHVVPAETPLALFLSDRGYRVVMPDYRGSTGHGDAFQAAGHGQLTKAMVADVEDTIDQVLEGEDARTRPVILVGESAGGYLVIRAGISRRRSVAAVVAIAPMVDVKDAIARARESGINPRHVLRYVGDAALNAEPGSSAPPEIHDMIAPDLPPFLFIHGDKDERVSYAVTAKLHADLLASGNRSELLTLTETGHDAIPQEQVERIGRGIERMLDRIRAEAPAGAD